MKLSALFHSIGLTDLKKDVEISFITDDSRKCRENTLFVCHEGAECFIEEAEKTVPAVCFLPRVLLKAAARRTHAKPTARFAAAFSAFRKGGFA